MASWRQLRTRILRGLFRRTADDRDLDDEIRFHLAEEIRLRVDRGASIEDARRTARRDFGSVTLARENTRAVWVWTGVEQLLQDLRIGCRILTRSPALSAAAVVMVALVIGGNTTVFSVAHGILRKPLPGVHGNRLVTLTWASESGQIEPYNSYIAYASFVERSKTLGSLAAFDLDRVTLASDHGSYAVRSGLVTANYFDTLGVQLVKGRSFTEEEALGASGLMIVIGHHAWQAYFQGADDIIGRPALVNGHPATIVGVAEPRFRGAFLAELADVWIPLVSYFRDLGRGGSQANRSAQPVGMIGRLAPGASRRQALAELTGIWTGVQATYPQINQKLRVMLVPHSATAGGNSVVASQGDNFLAVFQIVTIVTLLIVCANVANLLVSRAVVRQREIALRQSLGASRVRIVRTLLAEGLVLSAVAWAAACLFAWWVSSALPGVLAPATQGALATPDLTPDWTVLGYALVLAVLCTLAFTVAPAIRTWRQELLPHLKAGEGGVVRGRSRLSTVLVVVQLAFSVLMLTVAGLAYRSLFLTESLDLRFSTTNLLLATINTAGSATSVQANAALLDAVRDRTGSVPGVEGVSYARRPPQEFWASYPVRTGPAASPIMAARNHVGPGYLQMLGVPLLAGREFGLDEGARPIRSAVINRGLAETLWPGQPAIGRTLLVGRSAPFADGLEDTRASAPIERAIEAEVVGVSADAFFSGFRRDARPSFIFLSAQQDPAPPGETTFYIRHSGSVDSVAPAVARAVRDVDARVPLAQLRTMDSQLATITGPIRMLTMLLTLFAAGSLLIATIGQYAVVAFDMRGRVCEFGLRLALGASFQQVVTSVLREGFRLTAVGLAAGFALSLAVGTALGRVLYGITPTDPKTYSGVFIVLAVASLVACYLPARRAARIDPIAALRTE